MCFPYLYYCFCPQMHIDTKWSIGGSSDKSSNDMRRREELVMVVDPIQVPVLVHLHVPAQYHACPCLFISVPIPACIICGLVLILVLVVVPVPLFLFVFLSLFLLLFLFLLFLFVSPSYECRLLWHALSISLLKFNCRRGRLDLTRNV